MAMDEMRDVGALSPRTHRERKRARLGVDGTTSYSPSPSPFDRDAEENSPERPGSTVDPFAGEFNPSIMSRSGSTSHLAHINASITSGDGPGVVSDVGVGAKGKPQISCSEMLVEVDSLARSASADKSADDAMSADKGADDAMSTGVSGGAGMIFGAMFVRTPT
mmetsp:Transcript_77087/g.112887  ORF Transcript_77087/g.112887 Transcript_77087/m.112887 type:complete len:164 (-) Transcript_77087:366-857(-)